MNKGFLVGRVSKELYIRDNQDGSKKVYMSVAVNNPYKNKDGKREAEFIQVEGFIKAGATNTVYDYIKKGLLIEVEYTLHSVSYKNAKGETEYKQIARVANIQLLESAKTK